MMRGYKKEIFSGKGRVSAVRFSGFALYKSEDVSVLAAETSKNCDCSGGVLQTGLGVEPYALDGTTVPMAFEKRIEGIYSAESAPNDDGVRTEYILCVMEDGATYQYNAESGAFVERIPLGVGTVAATVASKDLDVRTLFICEGKAYYFKNGTWLRITVANPTGGLCVCKNRAFASSKPYTVAYSDPTKPWEFAQSLDDSGSIALPSECGEIVALHTFENSVYIFFERGIMRLTADGAAREFCVEPITYGGDLIFGNSVGVCGATMFFLAADGVYRFDGKETKKVCESLRIYPKRTGQVCNHAACGGYFVLRYLDEKGERKTVVLAEDGKSGYYASDFEGLSESNKKAFCKSGGMLSVLTMDGALPAGEAYVFESGALGFGMTGRKTLRGLRFEGEGSFRCEIINGKNVRSAVLTFVNGAAEMPCIERGESFRFRFYLEKGTVIRTMTADLVTKA